MDAIRAWKQVKGDFLFDNVMAHFLLFKAEFIKGGSSFKFFPYPASWLRDQDFTDAPESSTVPKGEYIREDGYHMPDMSEYERHFAASTGDDPPEGTPNE